MSVTTYRNNECKYRLDKLDKVVYLISEDALKNIHIDDGEAYVDEITEEPMALSVYNIELTDTDTLDERYKFTHTLSFSVHGYANYRDFGGKYYAIVKSLDGEYWLVNPLFPCKVTYTYTLDNSNSHTDFTLSTISNFPTLRIHDIDHATPYVCEYKHCTFSKLRLNETKYSLKVEDTVLFTNDGFKDVIYDKNSASFTEVFDGKNVSHEISFKIKFDEYKSSWHYNLLEFTDNIYASIIDTSCGNFVTCGFGFGLNPSFSVNANNESTPDNIQIRLVDMHDNGDFIGYSNHLVVRKDGALTYVYTNKYNGYECIGNNLARYLLKEEVDALMNPTGNYMCLEGYEERFGSFLNIVGTFSETETFVSYECSDNCKMQSSFPLEFVFNTVSCRDYNVLCDTDWTITSSDSHITVSPTAGTANTSATVRICNTLEPTASPVKSTLAVSYCEKTVNYNVTVVESDSCFTAGAVFDISANGQYVVIPTSCCVNSVTDVGGTITNISIQNNYIRVYVPQNNTGVLRQFILNVIFCDGNDSTVVINQGTGFERWVKESTACTNNQKCDVERKYTGTTALDINTYTNETRYTNCQDSIECSTTITRWVDTTETTCSGGKKWIIQAEQISYDGGNVWTNTGNKRLGAETPDPNGDCAGVEEFEEWREEGTICDNTTKYNRLRLYISTDNANWYATDVYKKGNTVIETNSVDCGFVIPSTAYTWEDWRVVEDDYFCDDGNKYEKLRRYVSNDNVSSKSEVTNWIPTDVYKKGDLLEANSSDCGYDPSITGNCAEYRDEGDTICDGFDKYEYLRKYVRQCENCEDCSASWTATSIYKKGDLIKEHSIDCGYVPSDTYYKWEEDGTVCDGYNKYKRLRKYISETGNDGDWYRTEITKIGSLIEENSEDCGYVERIHYEYRWIETTNTKCIGTTKYYLYKKQRRREGSSGDWEDVIPTQYSVDGGGTKPLRVAEINSEDCGYTPQPDPKYRWVVMDIRYYWICADCSDDTQDQSKIEYRETGNTSTLESATCNDNSSLVTSDYENKDIVYAKIGTCVTSISNGAFSGKTNLAEVLIPNSVTSIGEAAFSGCTSIVDFSLPMSITSIGANAFNGCIQLNKIMLPNNLQTLGNAAFKGCKNFPSINIPNGIRMIPSECFYDCDGMTDIYIPSTVRLLGSKSFGECNGLVNMTVYSVEPPAIYNDTFSNMNANLKIRVPAESVDAYKTAWSAYANNIVAIS